MNTISICFNICRFSLKIFEAYFRVGVGIKEQSKSTLKGNYSSSLDDAACFPFALTLGSLVIFSLSKKTSQLC